MQVKTGSYTGNGESYNIQFKHHTYEDITSGNWLNGKYEFTFKDGCSETGKLEAIKDN